MTDDRLERTSSFAHHLRAPPAPPSSYIQVPSGVRVRPRSSELMVVMTFLASDSLPCVKMVMLCCEKRACSNHVGISTEGSPCFQLDIAASFQNRRVERHVCFATETGFVRKIGKLPVRATSPGLLLPLYTPAREGRWVSTTRNHR